MPEKDANSTGLYTNGALPTTPAITLGGGVNLHSGDPFKVHLTYNGTTLTMTITDANVPTRTFTTSWTVNIPGIVGRDYGVRRLHRGHRRCDGHSGVD